MGKQEKLKAKLLNSCKGFLWRDLVSLLVSMGYEEMQGNGSRVKFDNGNPDHMINLHKPHPNKEMKQYAVKQVIEKLREARLL